MATVITEHPSTAYRLVLLPDGRTGLATLIIPKTSTVVETGYTVAFRGKATDSASPKLMRTDDVITMSIVPVGARPGEIVAFGTSFRNHNPLTYATGKRTRVTLNTTAEKGDGIHFFWDPKTPLLWPTLFR
jgi:hypothetical protein